MPRDKDLKRRVRARMEKTGEAYTTARARLLKKKRAEPVSATAAPDYAALAGMSDAAVERATGRGWEKWVRVLDRLGAASMSHRAIAELVREKWETSAWWSQMVTVGYERIKGLREKGQRRGGGFEVNKSKTLPVPVGALYGAFRNAGTRRKWLPGVAWKVKTATADKSMRVLWPDGTPLEINFTAKGEAKSQVSVQHRQLPGKKEAEAMREYWAERLKALTGLLKP